MVPYLDAMEIFYKNFQKFQREEPLSFVEWQTDRKFNIHRLGEKMPKPGKVTDIEVFLKEFNRPIFLVHGEAINYLKINVIFGRSSFEHAFEKDKITSVFRCKHFGNFFEITEEEKWLQKIFNISETYRNGRGQLQFDIRLRQ